MHYEEKADTSKQIQTPTPQPQHTLSKYGEY